MGCSGCGTEIASARLLAAAVPVVICSVHQKETEETNSLTSARLSRTNFHSGVQWYLTLSDTAVNCSSGSSSLGTTLRTCRPRSLSGTTRFGPTRSARAAFRFEGSGHPSRTRDPFRERQYHAFRGTRQGPRHRLAKALRSRRSEDSHPGFVGLRLLADLPLNVQFLA